MNETPDTQVSARFARAVGFAAEVHRTQARKGSRVPYLAHLLAVSSLVLEDGGDEDEAIAGLLHDAVEDGDLPMSEMLDRIGEQFGDRVAGLVGMHRRGRRRRRGPLAGELGRPQAAHHRRAGRRGP
ncbi:MAG: HD domain-containing protein, partial [Egibacteraceae bacterium]